LSSSLASDTSCTVQPVILNSIVLKIENFVKPSFFPPAITDWDRSFLCLISAQFTGWQDALLIVRPDTLLAWHRKIARWKWTTCFKGMGRPRINPEIRALVIRMKKENRTWGAKRIHGETQKLGIEISESSIRAILRRARLHPWDGTPSPSWSQFLRSHKRVWAIDFFTVHSAAFKMIYVLVILDIHSRELISTYVTKNPSCEWVENTMRGQLSAVEPPELLIRDRDPAFEHSNLDSILRSRGTQPIRCPRRSPKANAYVERLNGTLQRECTDHFLFFTEGQLKSTLDEYSEYYNIARCHQGLGQRVPVSNLSVSNQEARSPLANVGARAFLDGLHHEYFLAA
jgi:putative transposase